MMPANVVCSCKGLAALLAAVGDAQVYRSPVFPHVLWVAEEFGAVWTRVTFHLLEIIFPHVVTT